MKSPGAGREGFIYAALLLFTAAVYWPVAHCRFLNFDDWIYVTTNPYVLQGLTAKGFAWAFQTTTRTTGIRSPGCRTCSTANCSA